MSSHGGGQRNYNRGGGPYDSSRGRGMRRSPLHGEHGRGRGVRSGSASTYDQQRIMDYYYPNLLQAGRVRESNIDESSSCEASMPSTATGSSLPPVSSKALVYKSRPGFGNVGEEYMVSANHFYVQMKKNEIFQYEIKNQEEVKSKALSRALMKKLFEQFGASDLGNRKAVYDGRSILYTAKRLPLGSNDFTFNLPDRNGQDKIYRISIRFIKELDLDLLQQFLSERKWECPYDVIAALDVVLRESPSDSHLTISRSFFSPEIDESRNPSMCYDYRKGFFQSLRPTQMGLSLNVDVQAAPFYKPINLLAFIKGYLNSNVIDMNIIREQLIKIEWVLKGVRVETTHMEHMRRRYRITGITRESADELMFSRDGTQTSVAEYFRTRYSGARINYNLPCIKAGGDNKNPKYLPIEVCQIVDRHRYIKKLDPDQVNRILQLIGNGPNDREWNIFEMVRTNNYNDDKYVKEFNLSVEPKLAAFKARLLPSPNLKYNDSSGQVKAIKPNRGQWNIANMQMFSGGTVDKWACINFSDIRKQSVADFLNALVSTCIKFGMKFGSHPPVYNNSESPARIEESLWDLHHQLQVKKLELQLLIVILPDAKGPSYGKIKTICETELGIVTQCCHPKNLKFAPGPYFNNLAMKINVKVNGCNTIFHTPSPLITEKPTIIFGADVTHPSPGDHDSPSIAAVVASLDWPIVQNYKALVSAQPRGHEIIENLYKIDIDKQGNYVHTGMIRDLLRAFHRKTNHEPEQIIFYRDGVSEGQFQDVLSSEINDIRKACASIRKGYRPSITFIVVQKRHHTRLFPVEKIYDDRSGNIYAGTVVDKFICHPTDFDFYLCSHAGIKGTSRPAHYVVLYDENEFSADGLQRLTNDLCYTYARCTRSVSVAPPALYAHLAAFRARYYMENSRQRDAKGATVPEIKEPVSDVMFFC